jgi:hypothetical protein
MAYQPIRRTDDNGSLFMLVNGAAIREACLDHVEQNWTDKRPRMLREKLA